MPKVLPGNAELKSFVSTRAIEVINYLVANNIKGMDNPTQVLIAIGYPHPKNYPAVKLGRQSLQLTHLKNLCTIFGISADFLLNENCFTMLAAPDKLTPIERLKIAVKEVDIFITEKG